MHVLTRTQALPASVSHVVVVQAIPVLYPKLDVLKELTVGRGRMVCGERGFAGW